MLPSGVSETLKVTPTRKLLQHVTPGRGGIGKVQNVISLHFEGNWMPIPVRIIPPLPGLNSTTPMKGILCKRKLLSKGNTFWGEFSSKRNAFHGPDTFLLSRHRCISNTQGRHARDFQKRQIGRAGCSGFIWLISQALLNFVIFTDVTWALQAWRSVWRIHTFAH